MSTRILSIFNHYLEQGGEARAIELITESLSGVTDIARCDFFSRDWTGSGAPRLWEQALWMMRNPASLEKIRKLERQERSDAWLLHNVFPVGSGAIYEEAERLNKPVIQYLHNFRPFSVNGYLWAGNSLAPGGLRKSYWREIRSGAWQDSRLKTAWFAFVLRRGHALGWWRNVRAWIAISDFMRERFIEAGVPPNSIFTLRHFWRLKDLPSTADGDYYLFLGRLTEPKGLRQLLASWALLENRHGPDTPKLVIAGDGPLRAYVTAQAERLRAVTYAGELSGEQKQTTLANARAVIVPSLWWEPLGLVVYEAYEQARPVLAARSGGLPEIVLENQTGLLHEPGNVEELADHVMKLESEPGVRHELGQAGRRWLAANTSEKDWQRRFLEIATNACGG